METMSMVLRTMGHVHERLFEGECLRGHAKERSGRNSDYRRGGLSLFMVYGREVKHKKTHLKMAATQREGK